jgi:transcriptional regulator with XRE-family HTH domain
MKDGDNWPELIAHYRIRHKLTQAQFAETLNVTQQTVSRWESGKQTPDPTTQQLLRSVVGLTSLSTRAAWQQRVGLSWGMEALFDKAWRCLGVSERMLETIGLDADALVGRTLTEVPGVKHHAAILAQMPFFEGGIRVLQAQVQFRLSSNRFAGEVELWPVLTSGDEIIAHVVAHATAAPKSDWAFSGVRILQFRAVMVDGRTVDLESQATLK